MSHPWGVCGEMCVEISKGPFTQSAQLLKEHNFELSKACLFAKMPLSFLPLTFKKLCFWACFCQLHVKLHPLYLLRSVPNSNPSPPAWLLLLPFLRSSVQKPVMSFCPSGSHDEVEVGCHPELWNGLRWGIQSARDY